MPQKPILKPILVSQELGWTLVQPVQLYLWSCPRRWPWSGKLRTGLTGTARSAPSMSTSLLLRALQMSAGQAAVAVALL